MENICHSVKHIHFSLILCLSGLKDFLINQNPRMQDAVSAPENGISSLHPGLLICQEVMQSRQIGDEAKRTCTWCIYVTVYQVLK